MRILLLLIISSKLWAIDCDLVFTNKKNESLSFWQRITTDSKIKNFDFEKYHYYLEELKGGKLPHVANTEARFAFITHSIDSQIPDLKFYIERLKELSRKEQKALLELIDIFNKKNEIVEQRLESHLSHFLGVYYEVPSKFKDQLKWLEPVFAQTLRTKVLSGLIKESATEVQILKTRNFLQRSIQKLTSSKKFQLASNVVLNIPTLTSGVPPILIKTNFIKITPEMMEDALLYGSDFAITRHVGLVNTEVKKQVIYNHISKIINRIGISIFVAATIYETVDTILTTQEQIRILEEEADQILLSEMEKMNSEFHNLQNQLDGIDPRDPLFNLSILSYNQENNTEIDSTHAEYKRIWNEIYGLDYPLKESL